jgi:hypothetical protein
LRGQGGRPQIQPQPHSIPESKSPHSEPILRGSTMGRPYETQPRTNSALHLLIAYRWLTTVMVVLR